MKHYKSKTVATWLAVIGGTLGLHRFYLHGFGDKLGWLHPLPTAIGLLGVLPWHTFLLDYWSHA